MALIVIDMQKEYFNEERPLYVKNGDKVLNNIKNLLDEARENKIEIIHVRHVSSDPYDDTFRAGSEYTDIVEDINILDEEHVVTKSNPGAFENTHLDKILTRKNIDTVAVSGLLSFICTDTTAREADAKGYRPLYIEDATSAIDIGELSAGTIDEVITTVQDMLFSEVVTTEEVVRRISNDD